jgi:mannose-6-phosphate isomerase-like protein (cupin superfamily)
VGDPQGRVIDIGEAVSERLRFSPGQVKRVVGPEVGASNVDLHSVVLDPSTQPGPYHLHPRAESVYVVLEGRVRFLIAQEDHEVQPNQVVFIPAGVAHSVANLGDQPARLLGMYAPPGDEFVQLDGPA